MCLKAIEKEKVRNMAKQIPLSCIDVFLQKSISYDLTLKFLESYGKVESVVQVGERTFRVVFA